MAFQVIHSWTLGGLIGAFVDLVLAYFLLCGSVIAFFATEFLRIFGLFLPCPCKGVFGYRNSNFCVHEILFEWPLRKICSIQVMALKRFPFDLVLVKCRSCNSNDKMIAEEKSDNRLLELSDETSFNSCSCPCFPPLVDRESGYDAKGKRIMNPKRRSGIRRRRRACCDCGKFSSVYHPENLQSDVTLASCLPYDGSIIRDKTNESINPASGKEVSVLDLEDAQTGHDIDEKTCHSYECSESVVDSPGQDKYSFSLENYMSKVQDHNVQIGNEENRIKMLEESLEEEKAAYAALYLELEKERAAAATAADEAMAMISRLQEERASVEMEARQYQRMVEERVSYDEEEMNILQEILIRRVRENHFLEKELEACRQMGFRGSDQSNGKPKMLLDEWGQRPTFSLETHEDPLQTESMMSILNKDENANLAPNYMVAQACNNTEDGEELEKNTEHKGQAQDKVHCSILDIEANVLDVHVIGDNIELREEENEKIRSSSFNSISIEPRNSFLQFGSLPVQSSNVACSCPRTSKAEIDTCIEDLTSQLSMFCNSRCKTLPFDSGKDPSCADNNEKLKMDAEIEILGQRLRMVQHERDKLTFAENGESEKGQLKLLEEIGNHLLEIKQLRNPVRGASLPPSPAKVSLKKRHCRSVSCETCESL